MKQENTRKQAHLLLGRRQQGRRARAPAEGVEAVAQLMAQQLALKEEALD
jgi:hypothetical protein